MSDPVTTIGVGALVAYLGKDGLEKVLGPTADYLGGQLKELAQKRIENLGQILQNAKAKLSKKEDMAGSVPPKVLKSIINDGSYNDDPLAIEYFGGVLASSKTESGRDDRGARIARVVDGLTSYQLRTHYLIYSTIKNVFKSKQYTFNLNDRDRMRIFIPYETYFLAMQFSERELEQCESILRHTFFGLANDSLIDPQFAYGSAENIQSHYKKATKGGIVCTPSPLGAELFLCAFGLADKGLSYIFDTGFVAKSKGIPNHILNVEPAA
ncbi:hypothetical protein [uncultured Pseudodesulfovibrio sp.]|uniref:hypothetical protein n=1 Tax=uncultured Pseudodesulfovibrio sp. TaxID=2035858 RepID=UPI0029C865AC|nr:hypothetical protein [uncultured Pseudodesulfovibrio sp.]